MNKYIPPVDQLLTYKEGRHWPLKPDKWPDYVAEIGLNDSHIPALIQMATDMDLHAEEANDDEIWAPCHAWRALGQLQAIEAARSLLPLFELEFDDRLHEELPYVYGVLGESAIPVLSEAIAEYRTQDKWAAVSCTVCLEKITEFHPDTKPHVMAVVQQQLARYQDNDPSLNGFLIVNLIRLNAQDAAPLIEQAYAADCVDLAVTGDWEDVQIDLGLLERRLTPKRNYYLEQMQERARAEQLREKRALRQQERQQEKQRKAKRKQAKNARKQNRGRKKR